MEFIHGSTAGVMLAASFFSLLGPSVELAKAGGWSPWIPVTGGFIGGVLAIKFADWLLPENASSHCILRCCFGGSRVARESMELEMLEAHEEDSSIPNEEGSHFNSQLAGDDGPVRKNLVLMVLAITAHNLPEGLALGFAFGGVKAGGGTYTLGEAIMLAIALAVQNIPEGMAVSIPLYKSGMRAHKAWMLGQLSGAVEVIGAVLGASFALILSSFLPFCLSFAAGAMIYVVISDMLPQSTSASNKIGVYGALAGFILMMALDTGLG